MSRGVDGQSHAKQSGDISRRPGRATLRAQVVRCVFIAISLIFLAAVLLAPLGAVFATALGQGIGAYMHSFRIQTRVLQFG